jgi:hypothetical protein
MKRAISSNTVGQAILSPKMAPWEADYFKLKALRDKKMLKRLYSNILSSA